MYRKYPCNREYEKIIRYNGNWFKLKSIFDDDAGLSDFDFNQELQDEFDFNTALNLQTNEIKDDDIEPLGIMDFEFDGMLN